MSENFAWLRKGGDGRLYAINPEYGFFGIAPGTSESNHLTLSVALKKGKTIFTNAALTPEGDVWWEGKTKNPPPKLEDWQKQAWTPASGSTAAHPNARYSLRASNCPVMDLDWE